MAKHTEHYGLTKPEPNDFYDIEVGNTNLDVINELIKGNEEAIATKAAKAVPEVAGNLGCLDIEGNLQDSGIPSRLVGLADVTKGGVRIINTKPAAYFPEGSTGAIKITFPGALSSGGAIYGLKIKGTNWISPTTYWELMINGNMSTVNLMSSAISPTNNMPNDLVRFWRDDQDHYGILIGESNTAWAYLSVVIDEIFAGFAGYTLQPEGWEISVITDISDITIYGLSHRANGYISKTSIVSQEMAGNLVSAQLGAKKAVWGPDNFGGRVVLEEPNLSTIESGISLFPYADANLDAFTIRESAANQRGVFLDINECANWGASRLWHSGNYSIESGDWPIRLIGHVTEGGFTYQQRCATFRRKGDNVSISFFIQIASIVIPPVGDLLITELPYPISWVQGKSGKLIITYVENLSVSGQIMCTVADDRIWVRQLPLPGSTTIGIPASSVVAGTVIEGNGEYTIG